MSYYTEMSPIARKQFYEHQKRYRSKQKNMCIVFPKKAHEIIKAHADSIGISVTKFMVYSSLRMCGVLDNGGVFVEHELYDQD